VRTIAVGRFAERLLEGALRGLDARASPDEEYGFPMMSTRTFSLVLLVVVLFTGAVVLSTAAFSALARGGWDINWGMGGGHMGRMMGGGTNTSNEPASVGGGSESVAIRDFAFAPGNLQVPVGANVTWTNYDDAPHTATAKDGSWDTGNLSKGDTKTLTFDKAGDYSYYCKVHPTMVARLQVR
jgi:plastocyanin